MTTLFSLADIPCVKSRVRDADIFVFTSIHKYGTESSLSRLNKINSCCSPCELVLKNIYKALNGVFFLEGRCCFLRCSMASLTCLLLYIHLRQRATCRDNFHPQSGTNAAHTASQLSLLVYFIILLPLLLLRLLPWAGTKHACKARAVRFFLAPGK